MQEEHIIRIKQEKCSGCQLCIKDCPHHNIALQNGKATIKGQDCTKCGHCSAICPNEAVHISGYLAGIPMRDRRKADPKEIIETLRFARSIRQYKKENVKQGIIEDIIEAGRLTPTARNRQDVSYIVLQQDKDKIEKMAITYLRKLKPFLSCFTKIGRQLDIHDQFFFYGAPLVILVVADNKTDGILAAANMKLVADSYGLGTLYSGFFSMVAKWSKKVRRTLALPKGKKVIMTLVLGYPNKKYQRSTPKNAAQVMYK